MPVSHKLGTVCTNVWYQMELLVNLIVKQYNLTTSTDNMMCFEEYLTFLFTAHCLGLFGHVVS